MPQRRRKNNRPKNPRVPRSIQNNPRTDVLTYSGPVNMPQEQLSVIDLVYDAPVATGAPGTLADRLDDYPINSPDWVNVAALFAEYRVLAMRVRFVPNVTGATIGTLLYAPFVVVLDLTSNTTPLASYAIASGYAIQRVTSLNEPWTMFHRMSGTEESTFVSTATPLIDYSFKTFATGLTASSNYGRYFIYYRCQFRGRL